MRGEDSADLDTRCMTRALELALRGRGGAEPNPLVGCVIADGQSILGEGWHAVFGGAHAEVAALRNCASCPAGCTMYVTLEPCNHYGKTPPCVDAILKASLKRVVVAMADPHEKVAGSGIRRLRDAGVEVQTGVCEAQARKLNAPYLHRLATGCCWVIGKWAMSLDGKIATSSGESRWISNEQSRQIVHELRGRVDGIVVGRGTLERDDPLLTARPAGPRTATRVVLSTSGTIPADSQLLRTARDIPVVVVASTSMRPEQRKQLDAWGCQTLVVDADDASQRWRQMLRSFAKWGWTNLLVEGGARVLGDCLDAGVLNEWHLFLAPRLIGGATAPSPFAGHGVTRLDQSACAPPCEIRRLGDDVYLWGMRESGSESNGLHKRAGSR